MNVCAVLSLLHEPATPRDSASRLFRSEPVLSWTLARLARSHRVSTAAILCWDDQYDSVKPLADEAGACVLVKSPRSSIPSLDAISAAQRWSSGWRGGLLGTCHFDRGFYAPFIAEALAMLSSAEPSHLLIVDPSSGLIDPQLIDEMVTHGEKRPEIDLIFTEAAPGLCGALIRETFLHRLARAKAHPGRLLSYWPDVGGRDPILTDACLPVPPAIARTLLRFTLDSQRQIRRLTTATADLNGQLLSTDAQNLLAIMASHGFEDPLPRDVVLEINASRATRPIYWPGTHVAIDRGEMPLETARGIIEQLAEVDDLRLTIGGTGDPLLAGNVREIVAMAKKAGIHAVHLETDLADVSPEILQWLATSGLDVISVIFPAASASTYARIMGVDLHARVMGNLSKLVKMRTGAPLIVPTFIKCRENLDEMEPWYDHFLRTVGAAVISGPSDYAGLIPDHACADMSPPRRRPCSRLSTRMTIHSDGQVASCEEDVQARQSPGNVAEHGLGELWQNQLRTMRGDHEAFRFQGYPVCARCREWHRP